MTESRTVRPGPLPLYCSRPRHRLFIPSPKVPSKFSLFLSLLRPWQGHGPGLRCELLLVSLQDRNEVIKRETLLFAVLFCRSFQKFAMYFRIKAFQHDIYLHVEWCLSFYTICLVLPSNIYIQLVLKMFSPCIRTTDICTYTCSLLYDVYWNFND